MGVRGGVEAAVWVHVVTMGVEGCLVVCLMWCYGYSVHMTQATLRGF